MVENVKDIERIFRKMTWNTINMIGTKGDLRNW